MRVCVVTENDGQVLGVFSSLELAEKYIDDLCLVVAVNFTNALGKDLNIYPNESWYSTEMFEVDDPNNEETCN